MKKTTILMVLMSLLFIVPIVNAELLGSFYVDLRFTSITAPALTSRIGLGDNVQVGVGAEKVSVYMVKTNEACTAQYYPHAIDEYVVPSSGLSVVNMYWDRLDCFTNLPEFRAKRWSYNYNKLNDFPRIVCMRIEAHNNEPLTGLCSMQGEKKGDPGYGHYLNIGIRDVSSNLPRRNSYCSWRHDPGNQEFCLPIGIDSPDLYYTLGVADINAGST